MFRKLFLNPQTIFFLAVILGVIFLYTYVLNPKPAEIGQVIGSQTVLNEKGELVVKYAFISGAMSNKISDEVKKAAEAKEARPMSEEIALRTSSSRTFKTNKPGVKVTEFISGPQYYQDDKGNWWQADYNTTTPEEFSKLPKTPEYARFTDTSRFAFIKRAFATTSTFYPDAGSGSTTVDGMNRMSAGGSTWADIRNSATSNEAVTSGTFEYIVSDNAGSPNYVIERNLHTFDTSSIPDGDTISSAIFSLYYAGTNIQTETTYPSNPVLVSGAGTSANNNVVAADYAIAKWGSTSLSDSAPTLATFASSAQYHDFAMNATGIALVTKTGVTKLGIRGAADVNNTAPSARSYATYYMADQTGTTNDPKLVVVHVAGNSSIFKDGIIFKDGVIIEQ